MKIGLTGATGFIGSRVAILAKERGHDVVPFSRNPQGSARRFSLDQPPDLSGLDAVVNLAGESIMGLWTAEKKRRIIESRGEGTRRIVEAIASMKERPAVLVNASAIGFYGDRGDVAVDETSPHGSGFLADTCRAWEAEAEKAQPLLRVARIRIGMVLGKEGAMKLVAPVFRLGLGGNLGDGRQWMSPVHVDDVAGIILMAVENSAVSGPLNAVLPEPVRNAVFTREVARAVHRPAIIPAPAFAMRLVLGELSHLLLDSTRVVPNATEKAGYVFRFPTLQAALEDVL